MCMVSCNVRSVRQWHWDGDAIVYHPVIDGARRLPGSRTRTYPVDIREFLARQDNAVVRNRVELIATRLPARKQAAFYSHHAGSFDLRARLVFQDFSRNIHYIARGRGFDTWQYPEETIARRGGDCEDRAFLLASMLLAAGVAGDVVRVAFGKLYDRDSKVSKDHVWVMYKNEDGIWLLLEPMLLTEKAHKRTTALVSGMIPQAAGPSAGSDSTFEYIPYFVLNDLHMWDIAANRVNTGFVDYLSQRQFWATFEPEFAASVHNHLFDDALQDTDLSWTDKLYLKSVSVALDINPGIYDPRDHFDNAYIPGGWEVLKANIASGTLNGLARAGHGIADFYAHSSYAHFAQRDAARLPLFGGDLASVQWPTPPDYGQGSLRLGAPFSVNEAVCVGTLADAVTHWNGERIISGRFAQPHDPTQGTLEKWLIEIPFALRTAPDFPWRGWVPHHNEIAVDERMEGESVPTSHKLYQTVGEFNRQFDLRRDAAKRHIRLLYDQWKLPGAQTG